MSSLCVVLDACVLFPASLRDTLLRSAEYELYSVQFTDEILEELRRNLVKNGKPIDKVQRLIEAITDTFSHALVAEEKYQPLIATMTNHEKDRHVLAAAIACEASTIVTWNLKDFPKSALEPFNLKAVLPDEFLISLFMLNPEDIMKVIIKQAQALRNPPRSISEVLNTLNQHVPGFVSLVYRSMGNV